MSATLSVVMPNLNHGRYIGGALTAIVSQSFGPKEVIVVDDASTDDSAAVVSSFVERHPFVSLLRNPRTLGTFPSIARGLREATGDYVTFPAADDLVLPGLFEKSMRLLSKHPTAGLCSSRALLLGEGGENLGPYESAVISRGECYLPPEAVLPAYRRFGNWIVTQSAIYRRDAVVEAGGHPLDLGHLADGYLMHVVSMRHGACFIPEPLAMWRRLEGGCAAGLLKDAGAALELVGRFARRLASAGFFPPDVLKDWERRALLGLVYELTRGRPFRRDQAQALGRRLQSFGPLDKAFFRIFPHLPGEGRAAAKLYIFLNHSLRDQCGIIARKLRRSLA